MKLSKNQETEIYNLIVNGYNVDSILLRLNKKYPKLTKSDILIVAKKNNINVFGKKDVTTTKGKLKEAEGNIAYAITQKPMFDRIKKSLVGLFIGILLLLVCVGLIFGLKPFIIGLCVFIGLIFILGLISYIKFFRKNKQLKELVKNQIKKK